MPDVIEDLASESAGTARQLPDLVILVHGTFGTGEDEGPGWWQRGSEHWRWLREHLPPDVTLLDGSVRLFKWDGQNSQIARLRAGNRLLALMLELERRGRNYHLVGHSHGGSVIWEALVSAEITRSQKTVHPELRRALNDDTIRFARRAIIPLRVDEYAPLLYKYKTRYLPNPREYDAVRDGIQLRGLRSWTTVGTPFMRYLPTRRLLVTGWRSRRLCLRPVRGGALTDLILTTTMALPYLLFPVFIFAGMFGATWPRAFLNSEVANGLSAPFLALWLLAFWLSSKRSYASALLVRERAGMRAARHFSDRWLGLWSPSDEAINVLSASARHDIAYEWLCTPAESRPDQSAPALPLPLPVPPLRLRVPVGATHIVPHVQLMGPVRLAKGLVVLANKFLEPFWRHRIARAFSSALQGSDLPAAVAAYVSPWPLPLTCVRAVAGLPEAAVARIDRTVADHNSTLGPLARELLMIAALEGMPGAARAAAESAATVPAGLIHTAYFTDEDVRALILRHIRQTRTSACQEHTGDELSDWLEAHRQAVRSRLDGFLTSVGM
jgi:hypothetical protein